VNMISSPYGSSLKWPCKSAAEERSAIRRPLEEPSKGSKSGTLEAGPLGDCFRGGPMVCFGPANNGNGEEEAVFNRILSSAIAAMMLSLPSSSFAQAPKSPRETIHVGIIDRTFFFQPVLVAIQNGFFADEGLNANMRFIRSGEGQAEGLMK